MPNANLNSGVSGNAATTENATPLPQSISKSEAHCDDWCHRMSLEAPLLS
jgi:hypothetical protein